ncbi:hypothetical protein [Amycolatopsis azurea]|uniref:Uncharacterized protein n=1 Tax=Amycolatopsis azurea DSM 43854 TaxID=1238180 RepID=M2QBN8_9PSEU|nr:hypothetical protein [Amycolatopsis azurea]EMD29440.1 hypothetical protein C791_4289 [Amycolatopsis azurea DSM 43854]OOC02778.1 hypothetical protein B0293_32075 [Amycolatopsis azurea DSM 43854]
MVKIWTEPPAKTDVEGVVRRYFGLLRDGETTEAEQLVDHTSVKHVLKSLWSGAVGASLDTEPAADEWERDLSWLAELALGNFAWNDSRSNLYIEITFREQTIEVALGFWVKPVEGGWVVAGPSTLW